jgi:hypothetical protein
LESFANVNAVVIALQAGCEQKPAAGSTLSLDGSVFSEFPVNITSPLASATAAAAAAHAHHGLSTGAIIGIAVGGFVLLLALAGLIFVCLKKRRRHSMHTSYDARYGAKDISSPNSGAYINPPYTPPVSGPQYTPPLPRSNSARNMGYTSTEYPSNEYSQYDQKSPPHSGGSRTDPHPSPPYIITKLSHPPFSRTPSIPVHAAYISNEKFAMDNYPPSNPSSATSWSPLVRKGRTNSDGSPGMQISAPTVVHEQRFVERPTQRERERARVDVPQTKRAKNKELDADSPDSIEQWPGSY